MDLPKSLQRALHYLQAGPPEKCASVCNEILAESPGLILALYLRRSSRKPRYLARI